MKLPLALLAPLLGSATAAASKKPTLKVHLVPHTHDDVGKFVDVCFGDKALMFLTFVIFYYVIS